MRFTPQPALVIFAAIGLAPSAALSDDGQAWNCRNVDFEISCSDGKCVNAEAHTAMDIHVSPTEVSWCAYSGCWTGAPSAVVASGPFLAFSGLGLKNANDASDLVDVTVVIDTSSKAASVLAAGQYATPAICVQR